MSGHSKWANIQHRKGRQDAKRSNLWTKLVREIIVAARVGGGGDPDMNSRLRLAILKAREGNVPKDTINNAILKGTGQLEGVNYEEVRYEGYGIGGASLIIDCTTDNRTRTVADVRHILSKHGGNMGAEGSVSFQFKHCGEFFFEPGTDEDKVMETALEAGADDVVTQDDGSIEVVCDPQAFDAVQKAFEAAGLTPAASDVTMKALNEVELKGEDAQKMHRLIDALEGILIPFTVREEIGLRPIVQGRAGQHTALQHVFARNRMGTADNVIGQVLGYFLAIAQHKGSGSGGNLQTARRCHAMT